MDMNGIYQVSNKGRIRSLERNFITAHGHKMKKYEKIRKAFKDNNNYMVIGLCNKNGPVKKLVHRLVAEAFIPNPYNLKIVSHKDCNKTNNVVENLEWCTCKQNVEHAMRNGIKFGRKKLS